MSSLNTSSTDTTPTGTSIDQLRWDIDALDRQIAQLITHRRLISRRLQAMKVEAGLLRTDLKREAEVLNRYRTLLSSHGSTIAHSILDYCKG